MQLVLLQEDECIFTIEIHETQAAAGQTLSLGRLSAVILVTAGRKIFFEL